MSLKKRITLDTLQIYFPWDDDLNTYFKNKGFGEHAEDEIFSPLIYTDNCEVTRSKKKMRRRFVLHPKYFNRDLEELGWQESGGETGEIVIPAEKTKLEIKIEQEDKIYLDIKPRVDGKEQYHIEYSSRSSSGKMYNNWAMIYFGLEPFYDLVNELKREIDIEVSVPDHLSIRDEIKKEKKQNQREDLYYFELDLDHYIFSISSFEYAVEYLRNNGFYGEFPSLVYDPTDEDHKKKMDPRIKYGVVKTKEEDGFWEREDQIVMKVAQSKITKSKRGEDTKKRGALEFPEEEKNQFIIDLRDFYKKTMMLERYIRS